MTNKKIEDMDLAELQNLQESIEQRFNMRAIPSANVRDNRRFHSLLCNEIISRRRVINRFLKGGRNAALSNAI